MADVMSEFFGLFFFGMGSDVLALKLCIFASDFEFWTEVN